MIPWVVSSREHRAKGEAVRGRQRKENNGDCYVEEAVVRIWLIRSKAYCTVGSHGLGDMP
jgi:hypothetical protein